MPPPGDPKPCSVRHSETTSEATAETSCRAWGPEFLPGCGDGVPLLLCSAMEVHCEAHRSAPPRVLSKIRV